MKTATQQPIRIDRQPGDDPSKLIGAVAKQRNARMVGNLRWYGASGPSYLACDLDDGSEVRVYPA